MRTSLGTSCVLTREMYGLGANDHSQILDTLRNRQTEGQTTARSCRKRGRRLRVPLERVLLLYSDVVGALNYALR